LKKLFILLTLCLSLVTNNVVALGPLPLVAAGPGNRIHGVDISMWQRPYGKPINYQKMAKTGVRFRVSVRNMPAGLTFHYGRNLG